MNETDFTTWMALIMLANTPPYAVAAYLFIRWRRMASRRWVRNSFLFASLASAGFVFLRIGAFLLLDSHELKVISSAYFVTGSYLIISMFAIATRITERRIAESNKKLQAALDASIEPQKTSELLGAVISELKELDKYRIAKV